MARSSVYRLKSGALFVDCQADAFAHFSTRIVAPLVPAGTAPPGFPRLNPCFEIDGRNYVLAPHLLGAVPLRDLGEPVASLAASEHEILNALDVLLTGV